jgi:UPF0042 nucleotide-binding protein
MSAVETNANAPDVIVITGMSGSGRTQTLHVFEDMGYFCIDNLPPRLLVQLSDLVGINSGVGRHLAVTCDLRSQGLFDELSDSLASLTEHELSYQVVFLEASDEMIIRRYSENRRRHPVAYEGEDVPHAVARERSLLADVKQGADLVIDTSNLKPQDLRTILHRAFSELTDQQLMDVHVFSFGFKYGMPTAADLMIDVRFLPNPYWEPELRSLDGNDESIMSYVIDNPAGRAFVDVWKKLLSTVLPGYVAEGKTMLSIAIGCTGGQHRSVAIANVTAAYLSELGYRTSISHRDLPKAVRS